MCMGGGGDKAAKEAQRSEEARQAAIRTTQSRVNQVFNSPSRAGEIADFVAATRDYLTGDLNRQKQDVDRQLKFAMARGGLTGGSVNIDMAKERGRQYERGLLDIENRAQGAGSELEAADQDARARLIQLATSGLDATTAAQQAAAGMRSNIGAAKANAYGGAAVNAFDSFNASLKRMQQLADERRGVQDLNNSMYGGGR